MKKLISAIFGLLLTPLVWAVGGPYVEGEHYTVISEQGTSKPEFKEFFSFYCPHCFAFEPYVNSLHKSLPEGTGFKKFHVDFMPQATPEVQQVLAQALALAKAKGKGEQVSKAFFEHIHVQHKAFASADDIKAVAIAAGLDANTYDKEIKSYAVQSQVKLMQKEQASYSKARQLDGVPTFIINGRYKIDLRKLDSANAEQDFKALVNYLLAK